MAKKDKNIVKKVHVPRMGLPMSCNGYKPILRRRAKLAPRMIAEGLSEGVSSEQGNLLKSVFDDPKSDVVDSYSNIHSDKFSMMNESLEVVGVDPAEDEVSLS